MRVNEFLREPAFSDLRLLAGVSGLDNQISTVTVVDTPDGAQWLRGGEFVITTGFMLANNGSSLIDFMRLLSEKKVACLGIKENRHLSNIPDSAISIANEIGLPLVAIPSSYAFADIINPVLTRIIDQQYEDLEQASIIHNRFWDLAVNDCSVSEILRTLSSIVGIESAFLDSHFKQIYFSDETSAFAQELQAVNPENVTGSLLNQYDNYTVANQNEVFGYVVFPKGTLQNSKNKSCKVAVEQAGIILILRMQVRISQKLVAERYKSVFLEDLLLNNIKGEAEIHNRAILYHWDFSNGGIVAVLDINNIKKHFTKKLDTDQNRRLEVIVEKIFNLAIREMKLQFDGVKYMRQSDLIAFLLSVAPEKRSMLRSQLTEVFHSLQEQLKEFTPFTISIGVGNYYENIRNIYKSYSEARTTINLSYALQSFNDILFYVDMGLYQMIAPIMASPTAFQSCERYIRPLEEYDQLYGQEMVNTLHQIILTGWNLKKASENMFLHYNSMKYRYSRICSILDLDLNNQANRLLISIALIAHIMGQNKLPDNSCHTGTANETAGYTVL